MLHNELLIWLLLIRISKPLSMISLELFDYKLINPLKSDSLIQKYTFSSYFVSVCLLIQSKRMSKYSNPFQSPILLHLFEIRNVEISCFQFPLVSENILKRKQVEGRVRKG